MLASYFNFTKKSNLVGNLNLIRFFEKLVVAYFFGPPCIPVSHCGSSRGSTTVFVGGRLHRGKYTFSSRSIGSFAVFVRIIAASCGSRGCTRKIILSVMSKREASASLNNVVTKREIAHPPPPHTA